MIMKRISIVFLFLFVLVKSYGQDTIYSTAYTSSQYRFFDLNNRDTVDTYFYFDSTQTNNIWQLGEPSKTIFDSAYSTPLAILTDTLNPYPNGNISSFEFVVKTDDWTYISFWHKFNSDSLMDGGIIEASYDNGASWTNAVNIPLFNLTNFYSSSSIISSNSNKPGFTGNFDWKKSTISYPSSFSYIRFRFTFTTDSINNNKEGWMIDNFEFQCVGTGIDEIGTNSHIRIFPNPTSNFISIQTENNIKFKSAEIKDVLGKIILTTNNSTIDLSKHEAGIYFVEVTTDKGKYVKRIIRN